MPSPSEESSLRLPIAMVETGRSAGSSAGEPVAPPPTRRGTAGGPMEPLELVTEDLRVRLEPVVVKSSEATEDASSSARLPLGKGECRDGVLFRTALWSGLEVDRSRSRRTDVLARGETLAVSADGNCADASLRLEGRCSKLKRCAVASSTVSDAAESEPVCLR